MKNFSLNISGFDQEILTKSIFPVKITTTSFENSYVGHCFSPYGLVSNLNCPKEFKFCNCANNTHELLPNEKEPSDADLSEALEKTKECKLIIQKFANKQKWKKFFGVNFAEPTCSYNCSELLDFKSSSNSYYTEKDKILIGSTSVYDNAGYFSYARRKSYTGTGTDILAFPTYDIKTNSPIISDENHKINGEYFKYYLEYSKTNATFWNTPIKTPLLRQAQVNLLFYQRIQILVNGDFSVKPGDIVEIDYPTPQNPVKNNKFSGKWMVYKIVRTINSQKHTMKLFLMRDGPAQSPSFFNNKLVKDKGSI